MKEHLPVTPELIDATRVAATDLGSESFWDRLANYFERNQKDAAAIVEPKVTASKK